MSTTIHTDATDGAGNSLPVLFTGPGAWEAALQWAAVLAEHREALEAKGKAFRDGRRRAYRDRMMGKGESA